MPDINLVTIAPSQLSGPGDAGLYDVNRFDQTFLAQGDSWFSIGHVPFWSTTNLLQQMVLSRHSLAVNCARPGVELAHMTDTSTAQTFLNLLSGATAWKWSAILFSGGGNDLIDALNADPEADKSVRLLLRNDEWSSTDSAPQRYLSEDGWKTFTSHMEDVLSLLLEQRDRKVINRGTPIFLHTYDYVTPRDAPAGPLGPWLYKALHDSYNVPSVDWNAVSDEFINRLADMWLSLQSKYSGSNFKVINSRGSLKRADPGTPGVSNDWENEIHPTPHGYSLLAKKWRLSLDAL